MVNNEIWLDSHATVSMIPEQDIYLGAFSAIAAASNNKRTITLGSNFTNHFSLVEDLYRGCMLDIYTVAATTSFVAEISTLTFTSDTPSDYSGVYVNFSTLATNGGSETDFFIWFDTTGSEVAPAGTGTAVPIDISSENTREEFAALTAAAIVTGTHNAVGSRSGAVVTITNDHGGDVTATSSSDAVITVATTQTGATVTITVADDLKDRTMIQSNTSNSITVLDSLHEDITSSITSFYGVIHHYGAPVPGRDGKLLSDNWFGLASSINIPATSVEPKQINVGIGGTRNFTYQFKGTETTSEFSLDAMANSFPWLYYALGKMDSIMGSDETGSIVVTDDGFTISTLSDGDNSFFVYRDGQIHRVVDTEVMPPLNGEAVATQFDTNTDYITYSISELESSDLPSFAVEYVLKKPAFAASTDTDGDKEDIYCKIFPGCTVNNLTLTAAVGQEVTCNISAMPKNTFVAPTGYTTLNGETDVANFINFGTRDGDVTADASGCEGRMRPFFFSDGTIELFGQEFLRLENMTLTIDNAIQQKRFIGSYDKRSQFAFAGQRTYNLSFTGLVTDAKLFDHFRQEEAFSLTGTTDQVIKLRFTKENGEELELEFEDYHVTTAEFPLTNDNGPLMVNWTIVPLALKSCTLKTYWAIQG